MTITEAVIIDLIQLICDGDNSHVGKGLSIEFIQKQYEKVKHL